MKKILCVLIGVLMYILWLRATVPEPSTEPVPPAVNTEGIQVVPIRTSETTSTVEESEAEPQQSLGRFYITAYCPCERCCGKWALNRPVDELGNPIVYTGTGAVAKSGHTISVDPSVIPLGSTVYINGEPYVAEDTGVSGHVIDMYFDSHAEALAFGCIHVEVFI